MTVKSNVLRLPSQARPISAGAVAIRRMRCSLGWSQERMAQHLGVSIRTYRRRETACVVDPVFDGWLALMAARKEAA